MGLNCEHSSDHCHHPKAHGFDHFYGITMTNLRDCQPDHGSVFYNVFANISYGTLGAALATLFFLRVTGIMAIPRRIRLGLVALLFVAPAVFGLFILTFPNFNCFLMRGEEIVEQPYVSENLTQRMTAEAVQFMERSENAAFFFYAKLNGLLSGILSLIFEALRAVCTTIIDFVMNNVCNL